MSLRHALGIIALLAAPLARAESQSIALLPLVGEGLGADEVGRVERTLQSEVDAKFGSLSIPREAVRARLDETSAKGLHCDRNQTSCLAQLGIVCRADRILLATLAHDGSASTLTLRLVDVGDVDQTAAVSAPVSPEPTRDEAKALLAKLDDPAAKIAHLAVRGPPNAVVRVDGNDAGKLPLDDVTNLEPGKHHVVIAAPGKEPVEADVELRRGETATVATPDAVLAAAAAQQASTTTTPTSSNGANLSSTSALAQPLAPEKPRDPQASTDPSTSITSLLSLPPGSLPWIGIAAGGGAVVVGAVGLVAGLTPRFGYDSDLAKLKQIEQQVGTDHAALAERSNEITTTRKSLDGNFAAWTTWGEPVAIVGGIVVAAGVAAAGAGAVGLAE